MQELQELAKAYRRFLLDLGDAFAHSKETKDYDGFADTFIDMVKSPEIGFSVSEAEGLIKMSRLFGLLEVDELPSHHAMKLMMTKKVDMELLGSAQTLSVTDFKELIQDEKTGSQERTYTYEIIKRNEIGNIKRVYEDEVLEGLKQIQDGLR